VSTTTAIRAARVASTIGVFKWILISLLLLAGLIGVIAAFASGEASTVGIGLGVAFGAIIYSLGVWVLFGWFEHTLRALAEITTNTAAGFAPQFQTPPQFQAPPQQFQAPPAY
jgi:hypothetical protein